MQFVEIVDIPAASSSIVAETSGPVVHGPNKYSATAPPARQNLSKPDKTPFCKKKCFRRHRCIGGHLRSEPCPPCEVKMTVFFNCKHKMEFMCHEQPSRDITCK